MEDPPTLDSPHTQNGPGLRPEALPLLVLAARRGPLVPAGSTRRCAEGEGDILTRNPSLLQSEFIFLGYGPTFDRVIFASVHLDSKKPAGRS